MMFEQDLADCLEFDSEIGEFRNEFSDLLESDFFTSFDGLSPSHSSDSGVDIIMDEVFDADDIGSEEQHMTAPGISASNDGSSRKIGESETGLLLNLSDLADDDEILPNLIKEDRDPIKEDHCYTSKEIAGKFDDLKDQHMSKEMPGISSEKKQLQRKMLAPKENTKLSCYSSEKVSERCTNKNAVMARLNRQRKKRYVENLESEVSHLRQQNKVFASENQELKTKVGKYEDEIAYLKGVLMNQSMLSSVIKAVSSVPGVSLAGTVLPGCDTQDKDVKCTEKVVKLKNQSAAVSSPKRQKETNVNARAGVCLHVNKENVSLEFCHHCSKHASAAN